MSCLVLVRFSHYVSGPFLWIGQPLWSGQPQAAQLVCVTASAPYVCWIAVGVNMSPFNEILGTNLANSFGHELLVGSSSLDPPPLIQWSATVLSKYRLFKISSTSTGYLALKLCKCNLIVLINHAWFSL